MFADDGIKVIEYGKRAALTGVLMDEMLMLIFSH